MRDPPRRSCLYFPSGLRSLLCSPWNGERSRLFREQKSRGSRLTKRLGTTSLYTYVSSSGGCLTRLEESEGKLSPRNLRLDEFPTRLPELGGGKTEAFRYRVYANGRTKPRDGSGRVECITRRANRHRVSPLRNRPASTDTKMRLGRDSQPYGREEYQSVVAPLQPARSANRKPTSLRELLR